MNFLGKKFHEWQKSADTSKVGRNKPTVKPVYIGHPWDPKKWPLLTGGRCLEVIYVTEVQNVALRWWSLLAGGL